MTNAPCPELTDPKAYTEAVLAKLGERDAVDSLKRTPAALRAIVEGADAETLRVRPFPGKWTPLEILGHLVDTEWTFGFRTRHVVGDDAPDLIGIDQDLWTDRHAHNARNPAELLGEFETLRALNLRFWRTLDEHQLARVGRHAERGEESLAFMLPLIAGHDLWHLEQLERYLGEASGA